MGTDRADKREMGDGKLSVNGRGNIGGYGNYFIEEKNGGNYRDWHTMKLKAVLNSIAKCQIEVFLCTIKEASLALSILFQK